MCTKSGGLMASSSPLQGIIKIVGRLDLLTRSGARSFPPVVSPLEENLRGSRPPAQQSLSESMSLLPEITVYVSGKNALRCDGVRCSFNNAADRLREAPFPGPRDAGHSGLGRYPE